MTRLHPAIVATGLVLLVPATAWPQDIAASASRWLTSPHVSDYRLGMARFTAGALRFAPFGQIAVQGPRADGATLVGAGGEITIRLTPRARPYLIAAASGGFLDLERGVNVDLWGSWSAGAGAELLRLGGFGVGLEARYHQLSRGRTRGVSLGVRLGSALGRRRPRTPLGPPTPGVAIPVADELAASTDAAARREQVAGIARSAMGAPYSWGGTDANGFDCSGLIKYAYGRIGIDVPRVSRDQARVGYGLPLRPADLAPGDILAFSDQPGGSVSHVGLYVGSGEFIHSASGGVRISRLDPADPAARWWVDRWVGARRVIGGQ